MEKNLITVRNYALFKKQTESYIHRQCRDGKIKTHEIDGVRFIVVSDEIYQQIQESRK